MILNLFTGWLLSHELSIGDARGTVTLPGRTNIDSFSALFPSLSVNHEWLIVEFVARDTVQGTIASTSTSTGTSTVLVLFSSFLLFTCYCTSYLSFTVQLS